MILYVLARGQGVTFYVIAYPVLEFLCLPSTLAPCSGDILPSTKKREAEKQGKYSSVRGQLTSQGGSQLVCFTWPALKLFWDI